MSLGVDWIVDRPVLEMDDLTSNRFSIFDNFFSRFLTSSFSLSLSLTLLAVLPVSLFVLRCVLSLSLSTTIDRPLVMSRPVIDSGRADEGEEEGSLLRCDCLPVLRVVDISLPDTNAFCLSMSLFELDVNRADDVGSSDISVNKLNFLMSSFFTL